MPELQGVWFHASTRKEAFMQPFPSDANSKAIAYWPQPGIAMERQRRANQSSTRRGIWLSHCMAPALYCRSKFCLMLRPRRETHSRRPPSLRTS